MNKIVSLTAAVLLTLSLAACGGETSTPPAGENGSSQTEAALTGTVNISGSTSMEEISKIFGEAFAEKHPGVQVDVQLGGSSVGVQNAQSGTSDIGNVSRGLKSSESGIVPHTVAIDGISVILNKENTVTDLTMEQLASIYKGEIVNWKDVGGEDLAIVLVGREAGSGTRGAFEEILGIADEAKYAQELTETGAVKTSVQSTKGAIGYVSMSYVDDKVIAVKVDGVEATEANAKNGSYALQRPFIMAVKEGELRPEVAAFLEFVTGPEGQALVQSKKLITIG